MADTFFGFESSLNNGDHLLPPEDDDCIENENEEEEYDALNDETFGGLEDTSILDDWEQQHEQYAEIAESTKHSDLENSISLLMLDDTDDESLSLSKNSVWSYTPPNKNGDVYNSSSILSSLQKASKSFIESHVDSNQRNLNRTTPLQSLPISPIQQVPKRIPTVEELEKNLLKSTQGQSQGQALHVQHQRPGIGLPTPQQQQHNFHHPLFQHPIQRLPPGLTPMIRHMPPPPPHNMPPGLMRIMPPHPFLQGRPPGLIYPPGGAAQFPPMNHPFNFPPPQQQQAQMPQRSINAAQNQMNRNQLQPNQNQRLRTNSEGYRAKNDGFNNNNYEVNKDEYAGLMTSREKQWLLNIQLLQLNTGTPYFDDYYYTVFKERKAKNNKENFPNDRNARFSNNRQHNRNTDRQDNATALQPRVYTPLQFENSLGKLQCGSVTAPRKIIDMDIVTPDSSENITVAAKDSRKTKQLLLELEALYTLLLKAEDLKNPLAISNAEKLREIKQKQRLRELELAPTAEQKQEILKLFKLESVPIVEHQHDYISKIVNGLLQDDKFASFLNIRKGKMLILRLLPHLNNDAYFVAQLSEIWMKILLSLAIVGRRDTSGDNLLPKFHPFFKRYIQSSTIFDILEIASNLVEVIKPDTGSRSTPLSHQGRSPLYFVLLNKFGVSALVTLLIRCEFLVSSGGVSEKQQSDWSSFLLGWAELAMSIHKIAQALELIPRPIFNKHCNRFVLTLEKRAVLEKHFVDSN